MQFQDKEMQQKDRIMEKDINVQLVKLSKYQKKSKIKKVFVYIGIGFVLISLIVIMILGVYGIIGGLDGLIKKGL
ncbi:hypothetical protein D9D13_00395 [Metamycoplasma hominis]|nr:hypothetical protein [Metamycoplasma hominis]AYK04438.1 hypothetical protein D9D13_00395 [Metamycoplasma hominis]OKL23955.1 hypothetical protein BRO51_00420 [Metamycoplasma hominis]RBI47005.1 hypothetical protein DRW55_00415 [Metamycoplasma hominis]RCJ02551.1 hypothetical protein DSL63_00415 [Metamycoplasma hominis]